MNRTYEQKTPVQIIESCLKLADERSTIFGGYLRDIFDPNNQSREFKDLDILITDRGATQFTNTLEAAGFLRSVEKPLRSAYSTRTLQVEIQGEMISMDISLLEGHRRHKEWCDFTCNNLCKVTSSGEIGQPGGITTRVTDPSGKFTDEMWLAKCMQDIATHTLTLMCPGEWLTMTKQSNREERIRHIRLIQRTMKMMRRGWKLGPSLNGLDLKFKIYKGDDVCSICRDKMEDGSGVVLTCSHPFHIDCIYKMACENGPTSYSCPLCREHLNFEVPLEEPKQPVTTGRRKKNKASAANHP